MATKIIELIIVAIVGMFYVVTYALCKASGDAERKYEELSEKKFGTPGGSANAV